ncbi:MAG: D-alanine--D-alanine ligase [Verrucomicrobia bacterium]|jgi:D-alanine-D-alanine ligase|nr:D-alanine--D-alanine ligase [Verrucomicrobiota bacterium]
MRRQIAVLRGGPGDEREVSLRSGAAVAAALRSLGHAVTEIDPRDKALDLPAGTEVAFLALHGAYGEDGTVQAQLEALGVPYTGCGVETSRVAFDKVLTKEHLVSAGVPTPPFAVVDSADAAWPAKLQPPAVLKPVCQGSSVGLHFIGTIGQWKDALRDCLRHDTRALLESRIEGRECTVGILDDQVLPVVEVRPHSGVYDYQSKYTVGATEYLCPARFSPDVTAAVQAAGQAAFEAVGGGPYARVDVIVDPSGAPSVLEINTLPGMTETSLFPKAAAAAGLGYAALCARMVELALARAVERRPAAGWAAAR